MGESEILQCIRKMGENNHFYSVPGKTGETNIFTVYMRVKRTFLTCTARKTDERNSFNSVLREERVKGTFFTVYT